MSKKEKAAVIRLLRACQDVVNTKEYQRIQSLTINVKTKKIASLKGEFEQAAIAVATMIGLAPKETT